MKRYVDRLKIVSMAKISTQKQVVERFHLSKQQPTLQPSDGGTVSPSLLRVKPLHPFKKEIFPFLIDSVNIYKLFTSIMDTIAAHFCIELARHFGYVKITPNQKKSARKWDALICVRIA